MAHKRSCTLGWQVRSGNYGYFSQSVLYPSTTRSCRLIALCREVLKEIILTFAMGKMVELLKL